MQKIKKIYSSILWHTRFTPNGFRWFIVNLLQFNFVQVMVFLKELKRYKKALRPNIPIKIFPCLHDRTSETKFDHYYFYQDVWGAKMCARIKPKKILDIGSTALLVGVLSQFAETTSLDIRPRPVSINGLTCKNGSITHMPFSDSSVPYINSLCVIEHIGLGRYGDPIDAQGIDKAIAELKRVLSPGGHLVLSVPLGPPCILFNAHRIFSKEEFVGFFQGFEIIEETFCIPHYSSIDPTPQMRIGEYHTYCVCLQKPA
jgi:SAM-dependent methyltransferase